MTSTKIYTFLWLMAGLIFSLLVIPVVLGGLSGKVTLTDPEEIQESADKVLHSIHTGDWNTLESMVAGTPSLTPVSGNPDSAEELIWNAYLQSLQWVCEEAFQVHGSCVTQKVTVTCLDISGMTQDIHKLLEEFPESASSAENRSHSLRIATEQILEQEVPVLEHEITLTFMRERKAWRLVPDNALQALLSGFTSH